MYLKVFCIICMWLIMKLLLHGIDLFYFSFFQFSIVSSIARKVNCYTCKLISRCDGMCFLLYLETSLHLQDGMCVLLSLETSWHLQDWFYVTRKQPGPVTYSFICGVVQQTIEQPAKIHRNVFLYLSWKGILHRKKDDGDCYNHS